MYIPAPAPANILATYNWATFLAVAISIQDKINGRHVNRAMFFLPNLSINGPTINATANVETVTKLAAKKTVLRMRNLKMEHKMYLSRRPHRYSHIDHCHLQQAEATEQH